MASVSVVLAVLLAGVIYSLKAKKLTPAGTVTGAGLALLIFLGTGVTGFVLMTAFFLMGTIATGWQRRLKEVRAGIRESGPRTAMQVLANAGIAGILAALALAFPDSRYHWTLGLAAAFSSAASDTLSSELGTVYGRRFYHILTLKPDLAGKNGVVSLEGMIWGVAGSVLVALAYCGLEGRGPEFLWIIVAGTAGNLTDSVLGAWLENRGVIGNDAVNLLNTLAAALVVMAFSL